MCLHVKDIPKDLNPEIATEDIPCYKLLQLVTDVPEGCYFITPFQKFRIDFSYENRCYMTVDEMTGIYSVEQIIGIKLFKIINSRYIFTDLKWTNGKNVQHLSKAKNVINEILDIYAGIHAYQNIYNLCNDQNRFLFKAITPKGSYYFIGRYNEIVADKMIIFHEIVK